MATPLNANIASGENKQAKKDNWKKSQFSLVQKEKNN